MSGERDNIKWMWACFGMFHFNSKQTKQILAAFRRLSLIKSISWPLNHAIAAVSQCANVTRGTNRGKPDNVISSSS